jgi:2-oxo-3-hexenedioate decarboxylase
MSVSSNHDWLRSVAGQIDLAEREAQPFASLDRHDGWDPGRDLAQAYQIQDEVRALREAAGERYTGFKIAITTRRKLAAFGLASPVVGRLRASGLVHDGAHCSTDGLIHPRIEPELAFIMGRELRGPGCSVADVLAATQNIACAFEILDSRFTPGAFHVFSAVADNVSTARHVIGAASRRIEDLSLDCMGTVLHLNGEVVATGASAQVLGHPAIAVAELVNFLAARGASLPAGATVLTGGIIDAMPVKRGDHLRARFQGLGEVSVTFD